MRKDQPLYRAYLEAVIKSLLSERELSGKGDFDKIDGIDFQGNPAYYVPYNIKEAINGEGNSGPV